MTDHESVAGLKRAVKDFCRKRDWDKFHDPKSLAIGIVTEAAELLAHFRFTTEAQMAGVMSESATREQVEDELADVLFFILRFSERFGIDLGTVLQRKLEKNEQRYPVDKSRGRNVKYTEL